MRKYLGLISLFCAVLTTPGQTATGSSLAPVRPGTFVQELGHAYATAEGLPSDNVFSVAVAKDGSVYAGTEAGLARFDGTRWTLVWNEANRPVRCIATDGDRIAVATDSELYVRVGDGPWENKGELPYPPISIKFLEQSVFIVHAAGTSGTTEQWGGLLLRGKYFNFSDIRQIASMSMTDQDRDWAVATARGLFDDLSGHWERVFPESGNRSWSLADARAVLYARDSSLWCASPQGVAHRTGDDWTLYEGKDGLPYSDFTSMAEGPEGELWLGTTKGAIRFDGERFSYREGKRWLPDNHVRAVAVSPNGDAWFATAKGVGRIERRPMTLAEKAKFYEDEIDRYNRRTEFGYVMSAPLGTPGDKSTATRRDDDNDGQWTGEYGAAACFAYAATKDPKARERATLAFEGLRFFSQVTQGGSHPAPKGFPARTIWPTDSPRNPNEEESYSIPHQQKEQESDALWKVIDPRWPTSADGKWYWKCDTSSDELDGHYFLNACYFDLVAETDEEKARVADVVRDMTDHLIEHNFRLVDHDGKPTRWANFSPDSLNHDANWWPERGLNSLSMLSYLRTAAHVTGDAKYNAVADDLIDKHGYAMNAMYPKYQKGPGSFVQFDDEMAFMNYYNLMKYETNPRVREMIALSWWDYWEMEACELNPFFNFAYAAQCSGATFASPWGTRDLTPGQSALEEAVDTLKRYPMNLIDWKQTNSHRLDIVPLASVAREGDEETGKGHHISGKVLPIDERHIQYWSTDAWDLDSGGEGRNLATGMPYLLAYYMGLYHGFIVE